jgi:O-Antigen ligase
VKFKIFDKFYLFLILCPEIKLFNAIKLYEIVSLRYIKFSRTVLILSLLCVLSAASLGQISQIDLRYNSLNYLLNSYPIFNISRIFQLVLCLCVYDRYSKFDQKTKISILKNLNGFGLVIVLISLAAYAFYLLTGIASEFVYVADSLPRIKFPFVGEPGPSSIYSSLLILSTCKTKQKFFTTIFAIFTVLTYSMTGIILILVIMWMLWSRIKTILLVLIGLLFLMGARDSYLHYAYWDKIATFLTFSSEYSSVGGRSSGIPLMIGMINDHPLFGIGFENWRFVRNDYAEKIGFEKVYFYDTPSSSLVQIVAEFGFIGIFLLIIGFIKLYKLTQHDKISKCFSLLLIFSLLASSNINFQIYWLILGLLGEEKL